MQDIGEIQSQKVEKATTFDHIKPVNDNKRVQQQSIGEMWARSVNDRTQPQKVEKAVTLAHIKPVKDNETENRKARFRQDILNSNNKQKEGQPNG